MRELINKIQWRVFTSEYGASMVEYALLVMLIAIIAVTALTFVGGEVSSSYSEVADGFNNPN
jgi:Flp pilus assembly pilin Flp